MIMIQSTVTETNKYGKEKTGCMLNFTKAETEVFIGLYYFMGLVKMPKVADYWKTGIRYSPIADNMSRNRFQKFQTSFCLQQHCH